MASEKTEKATPKKREDARKKGQVARSADLTGAMTMLAGLVVLGATGPSTAGRLAEVMRETLSAAPNHEMVAQHSVGTVLLDAGSATALAVAPVALTCAVVAVLVTLPQVGMRPTPKALVPDSKRLNPVSGFKNIYGPNALVELIKNLAKVGVVAAVTLPALLPHLTSMASLVGMSPLELAGRLTHDIRGIALRAAAAYLFIGLLDLFWQRYRHEKSLRMDTQELKEEQKSYALPAEIRGAMRRRQMANARARMMDAVPIADVIVTNPTHYSVALKYAGGTSAPEVVAKGKDLVALRIREIAREHGVPIVPDPPLARSLHATVEIGREIPEELFQAVAQVLAYVYRVAGRRRPLSA